MTTSANDAGAPTRPVLDAERLERLWSLGVLDTPPEAAFDNLTTLVSRLLTVPVALVSFVDRDRQVFQSCHGVIPEPWMSRRETPLTHSFCQHVVDGSAPLIIEDAREHPLVCDNLAVSELGVIAYAGMPIRTPDGFVLGSLCAIDGQPRSWTEEEISSLSMLADSLNAEIALRIQIADELLLREDLETAQSEAVRASEAKDRLLANVSHQLRTPLAGIIGFTELLDDDRLDDEQRSYLRVVSDSADALLHSVTALISYVDTFSGAPQKEREAFEPALLLNKTIDAVRARSGRPDPSIRLDVADSMPTDLMGSPDAVRVAMRELLRNAIDFGSNSEVVVEAAVDHASDGPATLRIEVSDKGIGIGPDRLDSIFEPLTGHDGSGGLHHEGLGMGLALARAHAESVGGTVAVRSAVDEGTTFTLTVPVAIT